jgi:hypothetical protein
VLRHRLKQHLDARPMQVDPLTALTALTALDAAAIACALSSHR